MVDIATLMLVGVVVLALAFDFTNGFHDTANAVATSVATRALDARAAIIMATAFNFLGAFAGTAVAKTIGSGLVDDATSTTAVVAAALIGAIVWNLVTWYFGLPSSSSHALIGGLLGSTFVAAGTGAFKFDGILYKVLVPMFASPLIGFFGALALVVALFWIFAKAPRRPMTTIFRRLQILSAGFMAFSHGSNDAQKTMGIVTLALITGGILPSGADVPVWVIVAAASAISLGTAVGGWRIIHTMGSRVAKLEPVHGFAAQSTAGTVILVAAHFGMPVSTTHVISGAIMGVGSARGVRGVRWGVARSILLAWFITIPAAGLAAGATWLLLHLIGLG